jgi:hypothetical protein
MFADGDGDEDIGEVIVADKLGMDGAGVGAVGDIDVKEGIGWRVG